MTSDPGGCALRGRGGRARIARTLVWGALPVATPLIFRPEETSSLFARLVGAPHATMATSNAITTLLIAWLASWIWLWLSDLVDGDRPRSERRVEWIARLGMLLALATLPHFVLAELAINHSQG